MKNLNLLIASTVILILASCSSSKNTTTTTATGVEKKEFISPCSEFNENTKEAFRATASATSPNNQFAKEKAMVLARNALAQKIETSINSLFDNYAYQYDVGNEQEFKEITKAITRQVTDQTLSGLNVKCQKDFTLSTGKYEVWIAIEMPIDNIGKSVYDKVSEDEKIRIDYDYEKFKEELQKEIEKRKGE